MRKFIAAFPFICSFTTSFGQLTIPDPSFGIKGFVKTDIGPLFKYNTSSRQVLTDSTASLYVLSEAGFVTKRHANGSIDSAYGVNGYSSLIRLSNTYAALQRDGKIVVTGGGSVNAYHVARLTADGKFDSTFGTNGLRGIGLIPAAVNIQNDGKIVVSGNFADSFAVSRLEVNGAADPSFNGGRVKISSYGSDVLIAYAAAIQADGKIIVGGFDFSNTTNTFSFALLRYNSNGTVDSTFDKDGIQTTAINIGSRGYSLAIQDDGKIVFGGFAYQETGGAHFAVVRYNNIDGRLDSTFNGNGIQTIDVISDGSIANSVAIQDDGKIIIAGSSSDGTIMDIAVARLNPNGNRDSTFDADGVVTTDIRSTNDYAGSVVLQDGKIVVSGNIYSGGSVAILTRYNNNGSLDNSFGTGGKLEGDYNQGNSVFNCMAIQADGKVVTAGQAWNGVNNDFSIVRYNSNGSLDSTFSDDGKQVTDFGAIDEATSIVIQPDGKIIVAGNSSDQGTRYNFAIARYNTNGSPDNTFNGNGRLLTSIGVADVCQAVALQPDNKIVLAGSTSGDVFFSTRSFAVLRINSNGTPDNTFSSDGKATVDFGSISSICTSMALQGDGKIVMAGRTFLAGQNNFALARLNNDGTPDTSFSGDGRQTSVFGPDNYFDPYLAIQRDGKIITAGSSQGSSGYSTDFVMARYNNNGNLDTAFGNNGFQSTGVGGNFSYARSIAVKDDGRIAVGGSNGNFTIVLYKPSGVVDSTFGNNGILISNIGAGNSSVQSMVFAGNRLYAAGYGEFPGTMGVIGRYLVSEAGPLPGFITVSNGEWGNPATWMGGIVPGATSTVIVRHNVRLTTNGICYSLKIESPGYLTVNAGVNLTITH